MDSPVVVAPFPIQGRRVLLLAEGGLSLHGTKTAACYLRYRQQDVVAILDGTNAGRFAGEVLGFGGRTPILGTVEETLALRPEVAVVGVAPKGGELDRAYRKIALSLLEKGVDLVSGLHYMLGKDPEMAAAASRGGSRIWDVREVPDVRLVASGVGCRTGAKTVYVTGTDCNVGKMTAAYELFLLAESRGLRVSWAATGQTGMILRGRGVAVDRVVADFIGGVAEALVNYEGRDKDLVIVEGQGSLIHPGYAGVALGLMFGVMPDALILVHDPTRKRIRNYSIEIPPLEEIMRLHEHILSPLKSARVVGIALNTFELEEGQALELAAKISSETGLPAADPVRHGCGELLDGIIDLVDD